MAKIGVSKGLWWFNDSYPNRFTVHGINTVSKCKNFSRLERDRMVPRENCLTISAHLLVGMWRLHHHDEAARRWCSWVSAEFLRVPIPRKGSGNTTSSINAWFELGVHTKEYLFKMSAVTLNWLAFSQKSYMFENLTRKLFLQIRNHRAVHWAPSSTTPNEKISGGISKIS